MVVVIAGWRLVLCLVDDGAYSTASHILPDILSDRWPPGNLQDAEESFQMSMMSLCCPSMEALLRTLDQGLWNDELQSVLAVLTLDPSIHHTLVVDHGDPVCLVCGRRDGKCDVILLCTDDFLTGEGEDREDVGDIRPWWCLGEGNSFLCSVVGLWSCWDGGTVSWRWRGADDGRHGVGCFCMRGNSGFRSLFVLRLFLPTVYLSSESTPQPLSLSCHSLLHIFLHLTEFYIHSLSKYTSRLKWLSTESLKSFSSFRIRFLRESTSARSCSQSHWCKIRSSLRLAGV